MKLWCFIIAMSWVGFALTVMPTKYPRPSCVEGSVEALFADYCHK